MIAEWGDDERRLTDSVSVLVGTSNGAYPYGNSLLVRGASETILIDPSIDIVAKGGVPIAIDALVNSHAHEDHIAGNSFYSEVPVHIHTDDLIGITSMDGLMGIYGLTDQARADFEQMVVNEFHFSPRPDAKGFSDGHIFDLGGGIRVEAVHLPGHTRGHSGFRMDRVFFLSDIDLSGFGPYYGDVWSDLNQFEASLVAVRDEEADYYVTYHHKGVIEGRAKFLEMLDGFSAIIGRRDAAMLEFLAEPRTIEEMVTHRFIYRPHVEMPFVNSVERRSAEMHVSRMLQRGDAIEVESGRFRAT